MLADKFFIIHSNIHLQDKIGYLVKISYFNASTTLGLG